MFRSMNIDSYVANICEAEDLGQRHRCDEGMSHRMHLEIVY